MQVVKRIIIFFAQLKSECVNFRPRRSKGSCWYDVLPKESCSVDCFRLFLLLKVNFTG